jgi:hypothetical protein
MHRDLDQLIDSSEPAIQLIQAWIAAAAHECEILPPSDRRGEILEALQVTRRSPLGALAYDTGGLLVQHGWLRVLGSVTGSHRGIVPVSEAFDLKVDILKQLADGG